MYQFELNDILLYISCLKDPNPYLPLIGLDPLLSFSYLINLLIPPYILIHLSLISLEFSASYQYLLLACIYLKKP